MRLQRMRSGSFRGMSSTSLRWRRRWTRRVERGGAAAGGEGGRGGEGREASGRWAHVRSCASSSEIVTGACKLVVLKY